MCVQMMKQFAAARRRSVPLISITTPDQQNMVRKLCKEHSKHPVISWDVVRGFLGVNNAGENFLATKGGAGACAGDPGKAVESATSFGDGKVRPITLFYNAHRVLDLLTSQALANARDVCKAKDTASTIVLLGPDFTSALPAELVHDVLPLDEPLPDAKQLGSIVTHEYENLKSAGLIEEIPAENADSIDALLSLSAFQAEQSFAMCLNEDGSVDLDSLRERKYKEIERNRGLSVCRGKDRFDAIGGCDGLKEYFRRMLSGRANIRCVAWLDELEKAMAGAAGDTSGVSQDFLGSMLTFIQESDSIGVLLLGPPGTAKSALSKAVGVEFDVPALRFDMGAMKGSLVGESETNIRGAFKVLTSISTGRTLLIATANKADALDSALKRRFGTTFFCDMPERPGKDSIWEIKLKRYSLEEQARPGDDGWNGSDIEKCCFNAWSQSITLQEAARSIIPVGVSAAKEIAALRQDAHLKYLDANTGMPYRMDDKASTAGGGGRGRFDE